MARRYWLLKTEPQSYSIEDLANEPDQTTCWDGVRNYQARNFMRDDMRRGDKVLIYHSSVNPPAVVGIGEIVREAYPDPSAWDPQSKYYDDKSTPQSPRWVMVDVRLEKIFRQPIPLQQLRENPALEGLELLRTGSRLSVQPVSKTHFETIVKLAR